MQNMTNIAENSLESKLKCRTCLNDEQALGFHALNEKPMTTASTKAKTLSQILWELAKIDAITTSPDFPQHLCSVCYEKLSNAYLFVQQAQQANEQLKAACNGSVATANTSEIPAGPKQSDCLMEEAIDMPLENVKVKLEKEDKTLDEAAGDLFKKNTGQESAKEPSMLAPENDNFVDDIMAAGEIICDPITVAELEWLSEMNNVDVSNQEASNESDQNLGDFVSGPRSTQSSISKGKDNLTCEVCHKTFSLPKHLKRHLDIHFATPSHECEHCGRKFLRKDKLKNHLKTHSRSREIDNMESDSQQRNVDIKKEDANAEEESEEAKHADESNDEQDDEQVAQHSESESEDDDDDDEEDDANDDEEYKEPKTKRMRSSMKARGVKGGGHSCQVCQKIFTWRKDLHRHLDIHFATPSHECEYCGRKFLRKDKLKDHIKTHFKGQNVKSEHKNSENCLTASANKAHKVLELDSNLCKPHGCKLIQCMICLSKHAKISDLRAHLLTHEFIEELSEIRQDDIGEISQQLYPNVTPMAEKTLVKRIKADIQNRQLSHLYSITNEQGYELSLSSSETESDTDEEGGNGDQIKKEEPIRMYTCDLCGNDVTFERKYKLFQHQMAAHPWTEAPHECNTCNARFVCRKLLEIHQIRQCKNFTKRFQCRKCPMVFRWKDNLKSHMETRHVMELEPHEDLKRVNSFECSICQRSFQMQKGLTHHMVMHQRDIYIYKCFYCPRRFSHQVNLQMHMTRHGILPADIPTAESIIRSIQNANGAKEIYCKVCCIKFTKISELRQHLYEAIKGISIELNQHHDYDSPLNYSIRNAQGFELDLNDSDTEDEVEPPQQKYQCEMCNLACPRKYALGQHQMAMHKLEQMPYKCDKCIFRTTCKDLMEYHKQQQCYNTTKTFQCPQCAFKFMWQENLDTHIRLQHPPQEVEEPETAAGESEPKEQEAADAKTKQTEDNTNIASADDKTFLCDKCPSKYNRKDRLVAHKKKFHSGILTLPLKLPTSASNLASAKSSAVTEKKFLCSFCGRSLTSSSNLIVHMRRHTGEKPFKCDFCDMAFPRSSDLSCHRRTHTGEKPHKCTVCGRGFSRSYKLQTHMRIHSGERPYKCTYCEKSFTQSNDLTLHVRRHTGERPYVCGICGERFIQGTALKNHRTMKGHYEDTEPRRTTILEQF